MVTNHLICGAATPSGARANYILLYYAFMADFLFNDHPIIINNS